MRVADIMTPHVQTVPPEMPAAEAWELMRRARIHHLVVVAEGTNVQGVLSDRDAGGRRGEAIREGVAVQDLMTRHPVTIAPHDTIRRVSNLMRGRTIGCLPVLDGKKLVGIVTLTDLLTILGRGIDRPAQPERRGLHHRVPHRKGHGAFGVW